jgi:acetyl esterase/lipase
MIDTARRAANIAAIFVVLLFIVIGFTYWFGRGCRGGDVRLKEIVLRTIWATAAGIFVMMGPAHGQTVNVWPGVAPGSEHWTQKEVTIENTPVGTVIFNVVTPTLTAYLPERSKATGTGIIIAPGGAFVALAIDLEATSIARWLQRRGIAAFVLKYRIVEKHGNGIPEMDMDTAGRYGIADGIQAIKVVREHAADWRVSRDRIGFMGFSAGAMVTSGTVLQQDSAARPSFAAMIYGGPFGVMPPIPPKLPPLFLAWAQDDPVARDAIVKFQDALTRAGQKPEIHIFSAGGHGFGLKHQGTTSDHWIDAFYNWLDAQGLTKRR